jgi:glycosyltransferase involved in cell wall biosynthesis
MTQFPRTDLERPLVSVLIRTTGRDSLARAIDSVAHQALPGVELLVVNAGGRPIAPPVAPAGLALRWLDPGRPLPRSEAANALLDAAQGNYLLFLDDDDWLLPGHLPRLAAALDEDPALAAAYGDVECVVAAGTARQRTTMVYDREFDAGALQLQNFLPIHAVLFRAAAAHAAPACRFAPELALFEDWDFWLQLAARGPFRRVPGLGAVYAIDDQDGSRHADAANALRRDMLAKLGARQLARWQPGDVAALVERQAASVQALRAAEQAAAALEQRGGELQAVLEARSARIHVLAEALTQTQAHSRAQQAELEKLAQLRLTMLHEIALMQGSLSWRVTRPLRAAKRRIEALRQPRMLRLARNVASAVRQDIRRNGVAGFARRLPYYLRNRGAYLQRLRTGAPGGNPSMFDAAPPQLREIRLHPDLDAPCAPIDASVSVVIPTLNAGVEFEWLLRKLRGQRGLREVEIVIVDSGSRDGTVACARALGAKVIEILPSEFSHSHARNLGAQHASGDYLLFMVQDAYPIGDQWLRGMLGFLQEHADQKLAAVSCAEYSRSDSEMMYDAMINTHYKFLGCLEHDRLGEWRGDDHMALRSQGQLSDVACLISRPLFEQYRYRGDYAEDLDLGIRLIKDGMRVAMLASVKAVHSHNRPAYYYLKRTFVDVVFLVRLFEDFTYPRCESLAGLVAGIRGTATHITEWLHGQAQVPATGVLSEQLAGWIANARRALERQSAAQASAVGDARLDEFVDRLAQSPGQASPDALAREESRRFADMFLGRLEHFNAFAASVYGEQDAVLRAEAADVIRKTFAATAGAALAFYCLDHADDAQAQAIRAELVAGV